jgi:hypothetical protein
MVYPNCQLIFAIFLRGITLMSLRPTSSQSTGSTGNPPPHAPSSQPFIPIAIAADVFFHNGKFTPEALLSKSVRVVVSPPVPIDKKSPASGIHPQIRVIVRDHLKSQPPSEQPKSQAPSSQQKTADRTQSHSDIQVSRAEPAKETSQPVAPSLPSDKFLAPKTDDLSIMRIQNLLVENSPRPTLPGQNVITSVASTVQSLIPLNPPEKRPRVNDCPEMTQPSDPKRRKSS